MRRKFDKDGNFVDTHGDYPNLTRSVAKDLQVPLIDMHRLSEKVLKDLGAEKSWTLFLHLPKGEYVNYPNRIEDNTHFNPNGAKTMAKLAIEVIKSQRIGLRKYLKKVN